MSDRVAGGAEVDGASSDLARGALFLRLSLALVFFASVADRFELLEPRGERWGDFEFLVFLLSSQRPGPLLMASVRAFSILEMLVGTALLLGLLTRLSSLAGGFLLLSTTVAIMVEPKTSLTYSVPAAAAGSLLLALLPASAGSWSLDQVLKLQHVGSGRWSGRLVRIGATTGLVLLVLLALSMVSDLMHPIRFI